MTTPPDDGGQVFPTFDSHQVIKGISLRDFFAGMALQGMMASETSGDGIMPRYEPAATWERRTATKAYQFADAMLAELAERNK